MLFTRLIYRITFPVLIVLFLLIGCASCSLPTTPSQEEKDAQVATIVAKTLQSIQQDQEQETTAVNSTEEIPSTALPAETEITPDSPTPTGEATAEQSFLLPYPVYYLSGEIPARFQVWRMEKDGVTQKQLTSEVVGISDFSVSPVDGSIVYLVNNQLYWMDSNGENRQLLVDGGPVDEDSDTFFYNESISSPRISPQGNILAYYRGGLNLLDMQSGESRLVIENRYITIEEGATFPDELFFPETWSPDGTKLLVSIGWMEAGTYAILDVASGNLIYPTQEKALCCSATWSQDSQSVYIASHYLGMLESGLWRFDAETGNVDTLLGNTEGDYYYAEWVLTLPNGDLQFFYNHSDTAIYIDQKLTMKMVRSASDGKTNRSEILPDEFTLSTVLWIPDGSQILLVLPQESESSYPQYGSLALLSVADGSMKRLAPYAYHLQWGP